MGPGRCKLFLSSHCRHWSLLSTLQLKQFSSPLFPGLPFLFVISMQHVPRGCCKQFPTKTFTEPPLALAALFGHSTCLALGFRSPHYLLSSLPFSAKTIPLVANRMGPAREAHPLRRECRKNDAFLKFLRELHSFRRTPAKLFQSAFWKLSTPCRARDTPFLAETVARSSTKVMASSWHFSFNVLPPRNKLLLTSQTVNNFAS